MQFVLDYKLCQYGIHFYHVGESISPAEKVSIKTESKLNKIIIRNYVLKTSVPPEIYSYSIYNGLCSAICN